MGNTISQAYHALQKPARRPVFRGFRKYAVIAVTALTLAAGCRKNEPTGKAPAAQVQARDSLARPRASLRALSSLRVDQFLAESADEIEAEKKGARVPQPGKESAVAGLAALGKEFRVLLLGKGAKPAADAYARLLPEIKGLRRSAVETGGFNHVLDLVTESLGYAQEHGKAGDDVRLGALLIVLGEIPAIRKMEPDPKGGAAQDAVYLKITIGVFTRFFCAGDRRFGDIAGDITLWADAKYPESRESLVPLFESMADRLRQGK